VLVPDLQFAEGVLSRLHARGGVGYDERAYLFVLAGIEFLQGRLDARRHVTGQELAWACRDLALQRFGLVARTVLECWGVRTTADFGEIVYALIDVGLLSAQPGDRVEDFHDVYPFTRAFDETYAVSWKPES
jgi:uncharacterized repeat protein (TIGR04138 family)